MKQKCIKILTLSLIMIVMSCSVLATSTSELNNQKTNINEKINQAEQQQQEIKQEVSETMKEIEKLNASIAESEELLYELNAQLDTLETEITETKQKLEEAQAKYDKQKELFKTRVVTQYKAGSVSYLDVLLNSASISEFISNYYYINKVAEMDTNLLNQIEEEKETIEKAKKELEEKQSEYKVKKANAEKQNVILKNNQAVKESYVSKLNDEERELQKQIDTYTSEIRKIDAAIKAAEQQANANNGGNYNKYTGGTMAWPTRITKRVNSIYAPNGRNDTYGYAGSAHRGVDINAPYGTSIYAASDGQVILTNKSGWGGGYGLYVVISHGNGIYTLYAHGSSVPSNITVGTTVTTDTVILYSGATGAAEGAHLHFEVWEGRNNRVNPCPYLGIENKEGYIR